MSAVVAPQWLLFAFARALAELGTTAEPAECKRVARDLIKRWSSPGRYFHNLRHLIDVLAAVDELADSTHDPASVRVAAWYHGAVFDSGGCTSENRDDFARDCALLARGQLTGLGIDSEVVARIEELILVLATHTPAFDDIDAQVLTDADLAGLAAIPQDYRRYVAAVRDEFAHIGDADFVAARRIVVHRLLSRRHLFLSPLGSQWERQARQNLEGELANLNRRYRKLMPDAPDQFLPNPEPKGPERLEDTVRNGAVVIRGQAGRPNSKPGHQRRSSTPVFGIDLSRLRENAAAAAAAAEARREAAAAGISSSLESAGDCLETPVRPRGTKGAANGNGGNGKGNGNGSSSNGAHDSNGAVSPSDRAVDPQPTLTAALTE